MGCSSCSRGWRHCCCPFYFIMDVFMAYFTGVYWASAVSITISVFLYNSPAQEPRSGVFYCPLYYKWCGSMGHMHSQTTLLSIACTAQACSCANYWRFFCVPSIFVLCLCTYFADLPGMLSVSFCPARCSSNIITIFTKPSSLRLLAHTDLSLLWVLIITL